jgi:hypothetical protein
VVVVDDPLQGAKQAVASISEGDLALLFVLADREKVHGYLSSLETK